GAGTWGAPAANIDAQRARVSWSAMKDTQADEPSLFSAGDHLQVQTRLGAGPANDLVPVFCLSNGAGRHRSDARVEAPAQRAVAPKGGEESFCNIFVNPPGFEHTLAGSNGITLIVQGFEGPIG